MPTSVSTPPINPSEFDRSVQTRRIAVGHEGPLSRHFVEGDLLQSHILAVLSATFPKGEQFFVDSVRSFRDEITDDDLRRQVAGFIGQETMHGREHDRFNEVLQDLGYPTRFVDSATGAVMSLFQRVLPASVQLAITAAAEHFTSMLAEQILEDDSFADQDLPEHVKDLFRWHALEECEHKAVAYDVYQQVSGDYAIRVQTMAVATVMFLAHQFAFMTWMVARDGKLGDIKGFIDLVKFLYVEPGPLRKMFGDYIDYYRRDFHPWMHDNRALITKRVEELKNKELRSAA